MRFDFLSSHLAFIVQKQNPSESLQDKGAIKGFSYHTLVIACLYRHEKFIQYSGNHAETHTQNLHT